MSDTHPLAFDATRTLRGRGGASGSLHAVKPIDLVAGLLGATRARSHVVLLGERGETVTDDAARSAAAA